MRSHGEAQHPKSRIAPEVATSTTHARTRESAPDRIGPYEVLGRLATGGMAELLLARRIGIEGFQKVVVLKRILPMFARNPEFVEMFLHEARLAATLEHPNIVQVFDIGKSDDDYYFAMAYLHGKDLLGILRELIRRSERLPVVHAIAIATGVAAGLHHAHEQVGFDGQPLGIVHRDVSPANAIVTYDGSIKLVDFGIAKAAASADITRVGVRKGKAAYMSPEQCRGDTLDPRADIWSLGVVLYEMLTMARLYRADTDLALMHRIVSQDVPPPSSLAPDVPPALEQIVMRCLSRDRELRYANALDLQHALEACARTLGLGPSAGALGSFVRGLFGSPPLPWGARTPRRRGRGP
jgi:serine/threonine protein kinase